MAEKYAGTDAELLADLVDYPDPLQGLQSHFHLELRRVDFSLFRFTHDWPNFFDSALLKLMSGI
jgi:hypothetical protein